MGARETSTAISVMLIVPDAGAAVVWYKDALGAVEILNLGSVAGLEVGGAPFFLHEVDPSNDAERSPEQIGATSTRIELFDDPEGALERDLGRCVAYVGDPGASALLGAARPGRLPRSVRPQLVGRRQVPASSGALSRHGPGTVGACTRT
jgi:hypothetical protein